MAKYAEGTTVAPEKSQMEIKQVCTKHGATGFGYGEAAHGGQIEFEMHGRRVRFTVRYPDPKDKRFTHLTPYRTRTALDAKHRYDAEIRRLWRVLLLTIKGKLEAIENGAVGFEEEMLAHIVVPGTGRTLGDWFLPQLDEAYARRQLPPLVG